MRDRRLDGIKFKRQVVIGSYVVDFACLEHRLIVELDGSQHAASGVDAQRDADLRRDGFRVLRFWNNEVHSNIEGVLETIRGAVLGQKSAPSDTTPKGKTARV